MVELLDIKVDRLFRFEGDGKLKAFADLSINGAFVIKGLRVVEGKKGLFVSMPRQQGKDGEWYNAVYPTTKQMQQHVNDVVLEAYKE